MNFAKLHQKQERAIRVVTNDETCTGQADAERSEASGCCKGNCDPAERGAGHWETEWSGTQY